jgi:RNA polymerase sigma-70 factor (ECF subfamily)
MSETSASLLERARDPGDAEAWTCLVDLYTPLIRSWARRYALQPDEVDDLVQEVLGTLARALPRFEHNRRTGALRRWLRTVTVNVLRHAWRRGRFRPTGGTDFAAVLDQLEDPGSGISQQWDREHDRHLVRRTLAIIEPDFRPATWSAFRRHVLEGVPARDAAAELGLTVNAVLIAKSRVLQKLRERLCDLVD